MAAQKGPASKPNFGGDNDENMIISNDPMHTMFKND